MMENLTASSPAITNHPDPDHENPAPTLQNQVIQHLQEYLLDLQYEFQWETRFTTTQSSLITAARQAKIERQAQQSQFPSLAHTLKALHQLCVEEDYCFESPPRENRPDPFAELYS